jgi:thymidine kinase
MPALSVDHSSEIRDYVESVADPRTNKKLVVIVADLQLLDSGIYNVLEVMLAKNYAVYVETLVTDFRGEKFIFGDFKRYVEDIFLLAKEENIYRSNLAYCQKCGRKGHHTQRLRNYRRNIFGTKKEFKRLLREYGESAGIPAEYSSPTIVVGAGKKDSKKEQEFFYQARCSDCHIVPGKDEFYLAYYAILNATDHGRKDIPLSFITQVGKTFKLPDIKVYTDVMAREGIISIGPRSRVKLLRQKRF